MYTVVQTHVGPMCGQQHSLDEGCVADVSEESYFLQPRQSEIYIQEGNIKMYLKETECQDAEWMQLSQNSTVH